MQALVTLRRFRNLATIIPVLFLAAACSQGDGPESIANEPATPLPPTEPGFCDPINFEVECSDPEIVNFNGGATISVDNPDPTGINTSDRVAQMQKFPDEVFGGTLLNLDEAVDFSEGESCTVKVWSPRPVTVSFKLEEQGNPAGGLTVDEDHSGSGAWEELCFDFTGQAVPPPVVALTIIFDNGTLGQADTDPANWTFYYDDITQVQSCESAVGPGDIQPDAALYAGDAAPDLVIPDDYAERTAFGFGSVINEDYADDETFSPVLSVFSGTGYGANVAQVGFIGFSEGFLTQYETVDFKVKGMPGFVIFVKLFDGIDALRLNLTSSNYSAELENGWFQVSIPVGDFGGAAEATGIVFESDDTSATEFRMLLNDIGFSGTGTFVPADPGIIPEVSLYDRDGTPDLVIPDDYAEISVFGSGAVIDNDFMGDLDFSPALAITTGFGYDIWNAQLAYLGFDPGFAAVYETLDFKVKGLSGDVIRVKFLNDPDPPYLDIDVTASAFATVLGNGWYQVSVPVTEFEGVATATDLLFETIAPPPDESFTFLLTDVGFSGDAPVDPTTSVDFEGDTASLSFDNFGGGESTVIANPDPSGINTSGQVVQMTRTSESDFGGSTLALPDGIDWSQGEIFRMKVWSQREVPVLFKVEGSPAVERDGTHDGGSVWQELCFDFTGDNAGPPVTGISIFFDLGTVGDVTNDPDNWTFYYDDIQQTSEPCPVPPPPAPEFTTITFDDPATTYTLTDFGGTASTVTNDPAGGTNQVVLTVKSDTAQVWAGTTVSTLPGEAVPAIPLDAANTQMSVRVYSPDAGIPVRLKIEDASDPAIAVETEAVTTTVDAWETLTFDFANEAAGPPFNPAATYNKVSIFFNFGTDGATAGEKTYYFDDIAAGPAAGDHGPGTAGVFTETTTESTIAVTSITNSIDFGGNNTVADPASTAIPAFEGDVVLAIDYQDSGSTFGGAVLNFGGVDLTAYDTLNFTVDTSGIAGFADLTIQIEPPGAGAAGTNVALSSYTPVATSGNWATYAIPLADFTATDFSAAANLGFWNPTDGSGLAFGTLYVDDVYFSTEGGSGTGDHGPGTAGVFTETTTESTITVTSITNSIDFGGNNTVADPASTAIPAFEGDVVLAIDYQDSGSTFGGAVLNFGGVDLTAYDTLNFTVDTSGIAGFADLTIQIEPPGAGAAGTNVALSSYTPVATSGNWATYAIPLADFTATDFSAAANLGFWNPTGGSGTGDHGPGTAGVFTETTTESTITVTSITNSIDFGGNNTVADPASTAIPAFEGDVVLSIDYQDSGSTFGGAVLNFGGVDLTAYDTLNFTVDTSGIAGFADLTIQIEPPGAGAAGTNVALSSYTPVATSGNWATYAIPLADFTATDFSAAANLGFWNPIDGTSGLAFGTLYVDDVYLSTEGGGGGGGGGATGELAINGGFETGDLTGWETSPNGGTITTTTDSSAGSFAANLNITAAGNPTLKAANLGAGDLTPGQQVTVSFDWKGSDANGGVVDIRLFSELSGGGVSATEIIQEGAGFPVDWTTVGPLTITTGPDVSGGVTLQFTAICGAVAGCVSDIFIDNVSIISGDTPVDTTTSVDFEGDTASLSFDNFGGGESTVIANPDPSGINTSGQVVQMTKTSASDFGGSTLALPDGIDWSQGEIFRMKVWSQREVPVLFKVEGSPAVERDGTHDGGSVWQELCFDFTGDNAGPPVTGISIFFDLGTVGDVTNDPDNWTFYYDDIQQTTEPCPVPPPEPGDHGPGTAGVFTETTTESTIAVTSITNSIDFGGNNTVADPASTAIPAFV